MPIPKKADQPYREADFIKKIDDPVRRALLTKALRRKAELAMAAFPTFSDWLPQACPDYTWTPPHFRYLTSKLDKVVSGEIKKLAIFMPPRHGKCLDGKTLVTLASGAKRRLDQIKIGDEVLSLDLATYSIKTGKVLDVINNQEVKFYRLTLSDGSFILASLDHRFLTFTGWRTLKQIKKNDTIAVYASPNAANQPTTNQVSWAKVLKIEYIKDAPSYDLEVTPYHNFIANNIVTHNSETTSVRLPAYLLERDPSTKVVVTSTSSFLAEDLSRKCRDIVRQRGRVELNNERQAVSQWKTRQGGSVRAVGVGGTIVGQGFDYLIVDDPVKSRKEVSSQTQRNHHWKWFQSDLYTRRNTADAKIVVILTRWHEDDIGGRIEASNPVGTENEWTIIRIPAICEGDDPYDYPVTRKTGEPLWADRLTLPMLEDIKVTMGNDFDSLYQQRPTAKGGDIFLADWFKQRTPNFPDPDDLKVIQVWDTALSEDEKNDASAMVQAAYDSHNGKIYATALVNERLSFPNLTNKVTSQYLIAGGKSRVSLYTEDKAAGKPLIQQLATDGIIVNPFANANISKEVHAKAITRWLQRGMLVLVDAPNNLNNELVQQCLSFPNATHDDLVDAFVMAVRILMKGTSGWTPQDIETLVQGLYGGDRFAYKETMSGLIDDDYY